VQTPDLVRMANQIADFFASYPRAEAVSGTATHIRSFWDPRMRRELYAHVRSGGSGLSPLVLEAIASLAGKDPLLPAAAPSSAAAPR
jgi:formate dehydrogenase subunit delta